MTQFYDEAVGCMMEELWFNSWLGQHVEPGSGFHDTVY